MTRHDGTHAHPTTCSLWPAALCSFASSTVEAMRSGTRIQLPLGFASSSIGISGGEEEPVVPLWSSFPGR